MLLGSKPLAEMTEDELLAAVAELQSNREALRNEMIKKSREAKEKGISEPKAPRAPKVKVATAADENNAAMLALLRGDDD